MREKPREHEVPEEEVPVVERLHGFARITSKELATTYFCEWHPPECLFFKTKSGCQFGEKCSYAHRQVDEQPSKRSKKNDDKSAVAMLKKVTDMKMYGNLLSTISKVTIDQDDLIRNVITS